MATGDDEESIGGKSMVGRTAPGLLLRMISNSNEYIHLHNHADRITVYLFTTTTGCFLSRRVGVELLGILDAIVAPVSLIAD